MKIEAGQSTKLAKNKHKNKKKPTCTCISVFNIIEECGQNGKIVHACSVQIRENK